MKKTLLILGALAAIGLFSTAATMDTYSSTTATPSIYATADSVDSNGVGVDLFGYYGALVMVNVGAGAVFSDTTVSLELELEESDDNAQFTDVADADMVGWVAGTNDGCFGVIDSAAEDSLCYYASYIGDSRYIRIVKNYISTGTAPADITPISGVVVRMYPRYAPVH